MLGNLIPRANIIPRKSWQRTWFTRQERIKKEGSEWFTWAVPATAATVIVNINIGQQFTRSRKYEPLDTIEIQNNDVVDITVILNNDEFLPIAAGVIRTIGNHPIRQVGIRNDDAAVATTINKVIISLRRDPQTIDQWARER